MGESRINDYNSVVAALMGELQDPEIAQFGIPETELIPAVVSASSSPSHEMAVGKDKCCERSLFIRQVEGLWAYLQDQGIIVEAPDEQKRSEISRSQVINFNAPSHLPVRVPAFMQ